ncbi:hypothetical protein VPH219E481_0074 [Vibrio phage 219E48-1]
MFNLIGVSSPLPGDSRKQFRGIIFDIVSEAFS